MSLPVRGAWIEIVIDYQSAGFTESLPVRGAWIEIGKLHLNWLVSFCRSPCGERGLKYVWTFELVAGSSVAPRAGSVD